MPKKSEVKNNSLRDLILKTKAKKVIEDEEEDEEVLDLENENEAEKEPCGSDLAEATLRKVGGNQITIKEQVKEQVKPDLNLYKKIEDYEAKLQSLLKEREEEKVEKQKRKSEKIKKQEETEKALKELKEDYLRRQTQRNFLGLSHHKNMLDIHNAIKF